MREATWRVLQRALDERRDPLADPELQALLAERPGELEPLLEVLAVLERIEACAGGRERTPLAHSRGAPPPVARTRRGLPRLAAVAGLLLTAGLAFLLGPSPHAASSHPGEPTRLGSASPVREPSVREPSMREPSVRGIGAGDSSHHGGVRLLSWRVSVTRTGPLLREQQERTEALARTTLCSTSAQGSRVVLSSLRTLSPSHP